jgi:hypothetical protein
MGHRLQRTPPSRTTCNADPARGHRQELAEIAVSDEQNPWLFPGDFKNILIAKTMRIVMRDGLNVMSELEEE